jgi:hypothetical protein
LTGIVAPGYAAEESWYCVAANIPAEFNLLPGLTVEVA